jgi:hypothetical protein
MDLVRARAAFDLKCPASELEIVDIGNSSYGVIGCGARASYVVANCRANTTTDSCRVIANTNSQPTSE